MKCVATIFSKRRIMKKYRVTRELTVKVYDYVDAEDQESAQDKANEMTPLLNEVADALSNRHVAVVYMDCNENIEEA